jgi:hypothetical protein
MSNEPIECVFIEYKRNHSLIRGLLGLLVQVGEGKDLDFSGFALLSIMPPPHALELSW